MRRAGEDCRRGVARTPEGWGHGEPPPADRDSDVMDRTITEGVIERWSYPAPRRVHTAAVLLNR